MYYYHSMNQGSINIADGKGRTVLLIDDEPSVLFALKLLLDTIGYKVREFTKPLEALAALQQGYIPDLVLCDLRMPVMNGLVVLGETRKINSNLPFLLMSAHANQNEVDRAKELGASGFIAKPFTPQELNEAVEELLKRVGYPTS